MAESEAILSGFTAGVFAFMGVLSVVWCVRRKCRNSTHTPAMKHSPSMEELTSVETDPQVVQQHV
jgi:hypothetical protein